MPAYPPFFPADRRVGRKRKAAAPSASPPPPPLMIVSASELTVDGPYLIFLAEFDVSYPFELLDPSTADPAKWSARFGNKRYSGTLITPGDTSHLQMMFTFQ